MERLGLSLVVKKLKLIMIMNEELKHFANSLIRELERRSFDITDDLRRKKMSPNCVMGGVSIGLQEAVVFVTLTLEEWSTRAHD